MNRTIKFRGKRIDNSEWMYGLPYFIIGNATISEIYLDGWVRKFKDNQVSLNYAFIINTILPTDTGWTEKNTMQLFEVDSDTIGQFTGLTDKNGKEIYEGDVIKLDDVVCPVTWFNGSFQMITSKQQGMSAAIQDRVRHFTIIGNIHDNPELINQTN